MLQSTSPETIDAIGPADPAIATMSVVQDALVALAAGLDARFVHAGETLAAMLGTIDHLISALEGVVGAMGPDEAGAAVSHLTEVAQGLSRLPDLGAVRERELGDVRRATTGLQGSIVAIRDILRVLRIFAVNIRIAAADDPIFDDLAEHIFNRLDAAERELTPLLQSTGRIQTNLRGASKAEKLLAEEARKVLPAAPRQLLDDAASLNAYQVAISEVAARVSGVARSIQAKSASVLGALQVGDRTRQRLEHGYATIQLLKAHLAQGGEGAGDAEAVRRHIVTLLILQLADTAAEFRQDATTLISSLKGVGTDAAELAALASDFETNEGDSGMLHRLEAGISNVAQLTRQLRSANDELATTGRTIVASVDELSERVRSVRAIRADVEQIAVNVRLRCHRAGPNGRGVAVIAVEVRGHASRLDEVIGEVENHLDALAATSRSMRERSENDEQSDASRVLETSLGTIREATRSVDASMGAAGYDTRQVLDMLRTTSREIEGELDVAEAVHSAINQLAPFGGDVEGVDVPMGAEALLGQISKLYTMARERQIHQSLSGAPEPAPVAASGGDDGLFGDDDGLFGGDDDGLFSDDDGLF